MIEDSEKRQIALTQDTSATIPDIEQLPDKGRLYKGIGYDTWTGLFVGSITCLILHSSLGFLMVGFIT
jgi:hypothetical protein